LTSVGGEDLLERVAAWAEKYGLKLGLYYALWDHRHDPGEDDRAYQRFVQAQLRELLTRYGSICELWFDGAWVKMGKGFPVESFYLMPKVPAARRK